MAIHESVSAHIDAPPATVFALVTDVHRLPLWNNGIAMVIEAPEAMVPGAVWKVRIRAMGTHWVSRSVLTEIDAAAGRFAYRSQSDDGNPSHADWTWSVQPDGDGSLVDVNVDIDPQTFWRRNLLVKVRRSGLRREMKASLEDLADALSRGAK